MQYGTTTLLSLESTLGVNAEGLVTVQGSLENDGGDGGVEGKEITISGSGVTKDLQDKSKNVKTGLDGKFTVTGKALEKVGVWEVQAHFGGDDEYKASDSNVGHYTIGAGPVVIAKTYLKLDPISDVAVGGSITVKGELGVLTDGEKGDGLKGKQITFTTTGPNNLGSVITDDNGAFFVSGKAPSREGEWKVQAHFSGDDDYNSSRDVQTYSTTVDILRITAENINVQHKVNETEQVREDHRVNGISLPINVPRVSGCPIKDFHTGDDTYKEITIQDSNDLKYNVKDKSIPKTISYRILYSCDDPEAVAKLYAQFKLTSNPVNPSSMKATDKGSVD